MKRLLIAIPMILAATMGVHSLSAQDHGTAPGLEELLATTSSGAWTTETVDSTRDLGAHVSVALHPLTAAPYISYYDQAGGDIWFARYVVRGGNCGPGSSWECQLVEVTADDVGAYNSIEVHMNPYEGVLDVDIAYFDATLGALKYSFGSCDDSRCWFAPWTIQSGAPPLTAVGLYTSLAYDGSKSFIAYEGWSAIGDESVRISYAVGSGKGNCGEGNIAGARQCDTILSGSSLGQYTSLAFDENGTPHLAFYDGGNGQPYYAVNIGSGGNCGPGNTWLCQPVLWSGHTTGTSTSLFVEADGSPHLAYLDTTIPDHKQLIYASFVGSQGNCGLSSISSQYEWQCDVIDDDLGNVPAGRTVAVAADANGAPLIVYRDQADDLASPMLKLAQPYSAAPAGSVPNCGPYDLMYTWVCSNLDIGGSWQEEGAAVAIATSSLGRAVAYHELDTYAVPAEGNLKVKRDTNVLFWDTFESTDTSRWSEQSP